LHAGVYTLQAVHYEVRCALTDTAPVDAYRGAGQPEAIYVVERLVDAAARELDIDPAELRRRNLIPPEAMPYRTAMGRAYDSGHFAAKLDRALELAGYGSIAERKRQARAEGKLRGLGICAYAKLCGGATQEAARVEVSAEGKVLLLIGTQSNGQGHATAYGQVLADELGVDLEKIELLQGDTVVVGWGAGTGGSWSLLSGGSAARLATEDAIEKGRAVAAAALEAAAADIAFTEGRYVIKGTDRIPLSESRVLGKLPSSAPLPQEAAEKAAADRNAPQIQRRAIRRADSIATPKCGRVRCRIRNMYGLDAVEKSGCGCPDAGAPRSRGYRGRSIPLRR